MAYLPADRGSGSGRAVSAFAAGAVCQGRAADGQRGGRPDGLSRGMTVAVLLPGMAGSQFWMLGEMRAGSGCGLERILAEGLRDAGTDVKDL